MTATTQPAPSTTSDRDGEYGLVTACEVCTTCDPIAVLGAMRRMKGFGRRPAGTNDFR
jgi:hypothetical protein